MINARSFVRYLLPTAALVAVALLSGQAASGAPKVVNNYLSANDGTPSAAVWVDNEGKVGIGNNLKNPKAGVHIAVQQAGESIHLQGNATGVANVVKMGFYNSAETNLGYVGDGTLDNEDISLTSTKGNVRLTTQAGTVLTAGANGALDVNGGASFQGNHIYVRNSGAPAGTQNWAMAVGNDGKMVIGQGRLDVPPANLSLKSAPIQIQAGAVDGANNLALYINSDGFVGIGRTSPVAKLHVNGGVRIDAAAAGSGIRLSGGAPGPTSTVAIQFYDNANKRIGFVGDADSSNLDTTLGSDSGAVVLRANAQGNYQQLKLGTDGKVTVKVLEIQGADLVENFRSTDAVKPEPGTVMVIDEQNEGKLKVSTTAYDKKVAGIVSGAGNIRTGVTLQQGGVLDGDLPVAFVGRVYCRAEAENGAIQAGDLLTTSTIAGYCMKASDTARANGAIIGKAMTGLKTGKGLVLVLVNLQ